MDLLVLNLAMDASHSALGFTTSWVNALARRARHVSVVTMVAGEIAVEQNVDVYSLGRERGWSEPRRAFEFYRLVGKVLRGRRVDACFVHMAPIFAVMFAPIAKARRIPVLLWYAHGAQPLMMRIAHPLVDRCVTSTPAAFRLPSTKLHVIGQGIDVDRFEPPAEVGPDYARTVVSIGRISETKGLEEMLAALACIRGDHGRDVRLELTGEPLTSTDRDYAERLRSAARELGIADAVDFLGNVSFEQIPSRYHRGAVFLNLSETGSIDKAILESMACGCVPVSRNESFRRIAHGHGLDFLVPDVGPESVADRIVQTLDIPAAKRSDLVGRLRAIVEAEHSLEALADKLMAHLAELAR